MKNYQLLNLFSNILRMLALSKNVYEFNSALSSIKRHIEEASKLLRDELALIDKEGTELAIECCEKANDGKPIIDIVKIGADEKGNDMVEKSYRGLEPGANLLYDKRVFELEEKKRELLMKNSDIDYEDIPVKIPVKHLPLKNDNFTGIMQDAIQTFITD